MRVIRRFLAEDRAQVLPIFALLSFVVIGLMGLAADVGRVYAARAELGRAVDAAALAGAKQLPDTAKADAQARAFISANDPGATASVSVNAGSGDKEVVVSAEKQVNTLFLRALGIGSVTVKNEAAAGVGGSPMDAVLAIDATSSMGDSPCTGAQNNTGCPIWEAKQAAIQFTNTLLPSSDTQVGVTPFRGCYNPPSSYAACVPASMIQNLSNSASVINSRVGNIGATGGSGTNVCSGLDKAAEILLGSNKNTEVNTRRVIVILSDGDNNYNSTSYVAGSSPVAACRPNTSPQNADPSGSCGSSAQTRERELDTKTKARADALKAQGVEIYVVAFGQCGTSNATAPSSSYCSGIGDSASDNTADQRLAKCMASSSAGSNDHYYVANSATELPAIFTKIAQALSFRLTR